MEEFAGGAICTQPRRIAAIAVAERVSSERGEQVGNSVGYAVRFESKQSSSTKLLFCTTGVLLRRLQEKRLTREVRPVTHSDVVLQIVGYTHIHIQYAYSNIQIHLLYAYCISP